MAGSASRAPRWDASAALEKKFSRYLGAKLMFTSTEPGSGSMKIFLVLGGAILIAFGLLFIGQGLDVIRWPSRSFMINEIKWTYYGGGIALLGLILLFIGRRR